MSERFLFQFFHPLDVQRVMKNGPWSFENQMLVLKEIIPGDSPTTVGLDKLEMWVQVFNLPFGFLKEKIGKSIANFIGDFIEYDESNNWGPWRAYMRIKVAIDVNQPLKKEWKIRKEGGDWIMLQFKYEKLGIFCFRCGIIGHTENFCATKFEEGAENGIARWGPYLRAEARRIGGTSNRWLSNGNEAGRNSDNGAVQEDETEIADQGINGLANVKNVVRTVIVQTIRNNQLITTKTQTLPPSPTTARPRQLLLGSSTSSTRIPRYQGTANENLTIVPLVSKKVELKALLRKKELV
jgi:hypothetical protein